MERPPRAEKPKLTVEQIRKRLAEIDAEKSRLSDGLNRVPAEFQESSHPEDDSDEASQVGQALDQVSFRRERLEHERLALEEELGKLTRQAA